MPLGVVLNPINPTIIAATLAPISRTLGRAAGTGTGTRASA